MSYSANGRGYTLICLLTVCLVTLAKRLLDGSRIANWLTFTLLPAIGFFTIPVMLYPYGGILVWLGLAWIFRRARRLRLDALVVSVTLAAILAGSLYIPVVTRLGVDSIIANRVVAPRPMEAVVRDLPGSMLDVWNQWNRGVPIVLVVAFLAAWGWAILGPVGDRTPVLSLTSVWMAMLVFTLGAVIYQRVVPFDRVWLFLLPVYLAVLGASLAVAARRLLERQPRPVPYGVPLLLWSVLTFFVVRCGFDPRRNLRGSRSTRRRRLAHRLVSELKPGDAVLTELPSDGPVKYYCLTNDVSVHFLYDYVIAGARRLFLVVNRPNGQTPRSVLGYNHLSPPSGHEPRLVQEFGFTALYMLER